MNWHFCHLVIFFTVIILFKTTLVQGRKPMVASKSGFKHVKLTTEKGISCGGYYIFLEICGVNDTDHLNRPDKNCCEDEIVRHGDYGFHGGDTIINEFNRWTLTTGG